MTKKTITITLTDEGDFGVSLSSLRIVEAIGMLKVAERDLMKALTTAEKPKQDQELDKPMD